MNEDEIPTLLAEDTGLQFRVFCPHCKAFHFHGRREGHGIAHCRDPESPFRISGYILQLRDGADRRQGAEEALKNYEKARLLKRKRR